jgi:hypothetical protein
VSARQQTGLRDILPESAEANEEARPPRGESITPRRAYELQRVLSSESIVLWFLRRATTGEGGGKVSAASEIVLCFCVVCCSKVFHVLDAPHLMALEEGHEVPMRAWWGTTSSNTPEEKVRCLLIFPNGL